MNRKKSGAAANKCGGIKSSAKDLIVWSFYFSHCFIRSAHPKKIHQSNENGGMNETEMNTENENERENIHTHNENEPSNRVRNKMTTNFICVLWPRCVGSQRTFEIG